MLRNLSTLFLDLTEAIEVRLTNVRDLMAQFRRLDVYHWCVFRRNWQMCGSYSIKKVLPALVPELSYAGLDIADGMAAMQAYHEMCAKEPGGDKLRRAMLEYCGLDTLAMVRILVELVELMELMELVA